MTMPGTENPQDKYEIVARALAEIIEEMKRIGYWQADPLPVEAYDFRLAFAADTMSFEQWLRFVFVPRVNQIIAEKGDFPSQSQVGTAALKNFDGDDKASKLVRMLNEFDALFG